MDFELQTKNGALFPKDSALRIAGVVEESAVDGPGLRFTVFTQGCPHACPGCHNPHTHPFDAGTLVSGDELYRQIRENPLLSGVTFSGGEPFCQPLPLARLARRLHKNTSLTIVTYTGYIFEELFESPDENIRALLAETDVLIDGKFLLALRDLTLRFRGSTNQRVIDVPKSLAAGAPVQLDWAK